MSFAATPPDVLLCCHRLGNKLPAKMQTNTLNNKRRMASGFHGFADSMGAS
jgi:hypothetical protein